jgi:DNA ligase D-like protein (predicted 3'-phosphoesterase)
MLTCPHVSCYPAFMGKAQKKMLATYRQKRRFKATPEPAGARPPRPGKFPIFVIQEHHATRLHYDFRLEVNGALKSWAVPKGLGTSPGDKRLAVMTEDHPMEYAAFEGQIPRGQYGAGTVMVWDAGYYANLMGKKAGKSMSEAIRDGHVEVALKGKKIQGSYALIESRLGGQEKNWLLIKMRDAELARTKGSAEARPRSVLTGRTAAEIEREALVHASGRKRAGKTKPGTA